MAAFEFVVMKPLRVGERMLEPGETTLEPNCWSARTQQVYLDQGYIRHGQVVDAVFEQAPAFTGVPPGYDEREPLRPRESYEPAFEGSQGWRCFNCRKLCRLPDDLDEQVVWQCWFCSQQQTIAQVKDQQQPTNVSEEMTRRGLAKDPTDNQQGVYSAMRDQSRLSSERTCQEPNCIRPLDHSGNHRNEQLREWPRKPDSRPVWASVYSGSSLDARSPIDPSEPVPGRRLGHGH
jgi:hypothetical protein